MASWTAGYYVFGTDSFADEAGDVLVWHINADQPYVPTWDAYRGNGFRVIAYEARSSAPDAYGSSDHDPGNIGIEMSSDDDALSLSFTAAAPGSP